METYFNSNGSEWTKKYKPIKVLELINNCDIYDENKLTLKYMNTYGINNVRSASYVSEYLSFDEIYNLKKVINDKCFCCGGEHFSQNCQNDE